MACANWGKGSIAENLFREYQSLSQRGFQKNSKDQGCADKVKLVDLCHLLKLSILIVSSFSIMCVVPLQGNHE